MIKTFRCLFLLSSLAGLMACTEYEPGTPDYGDVPVERLLLRADLATSDWRPLFNGRDLAGWTPKITGYPTGENFAETFRAVDGNLRVAYDGYDNFGERYGHLVTEHSYSHYILSLEYRFVGEQVAGGPGWAFENSGVMLHSQSAHSMGLEQDFPISIEVQLLGGTGTDHRPTANVCTPGTHVEINGELSWDHCIESASATFPASPWVRLEVVVLGDELIEHRVNGERVLHYRHPVIGGWLVSGHDEKMKSDGTALMSGHISLQSESHPVEFRNVELLDLRGCKDPAAPNYRSYLAVHNAGQCEISEK